MRRKRWALFGLLTRAREHRGVALITVLWVLVLLSLMATGFTRTIRTDLYLARNLIENANAEALADAGVYRAIAGLLDSDTGEVWRVDGTVYAWIYGGGEIRVSLQDEGGKLDLNQAQDRLLVGLFRSAGLSQQEAETMVDRIADFRDANELHRLHGAEDSHYAEAGLPWDAKDAPFEALEELRQVLGMTPEIYRRVAPALTLYAGQEPPYEPTAPSEVRAFYGTLDILGENAGADDRASQEDPHPNMERGELTGSPAILEQGPSAQRSSVPYYTIHAEAMTRDGAVFVREAIVRLTGVPGSPYEIQTWTQGRRSLFDPESGGSSRRR